MFEGLEVKRLKEQEKGFGESNSGCTYGKIFILQFNSCQRAFNMEESLDNKKKSTARPVRRLQSGTIGT